MKRPVFAASMAFVIGSWSALASSSVDIPFTKTKLSNGMTVIFHEDHGLPVVAVDVLYNVGSRFEAKGRTGFAHLFEHLMFMGTKRAPTGKFDEWMEAVGGHNNAWTSEDRTGYWDVGPKACLNLFLWLEADRLRDIGPLMTAEKLKAQRDVVRNERRQRTENTPYGKGEIRLSELLYPVEHPYHHPPIGSHEDLEAATVQDVKDFFATHYVPSNASMAVAGDFSREDAMRAIKAWMETVPTKDAPKDPGAPGFSDTKTTLTSVVTDTLTDDVELTKITYAWQTPRHFTLQDAHLDLLGAVLGGGKSSRLYTALVVDKKLAQSVSAGESSGVLGSHFEISVLARPHVDLDVLEKAIDMEIETVKKRGVRDAELLRARNVLMTGFISSLQQVGTRAKLLNTYEMDTGDPGFITKDLARYESAKPSDLQDVATKYLMLDKRAVLRIVPKISEVKSR